MARSWPASSTSPRLRRPPSPAAGATLPWQMCSASRSERAALMVVRHFAEAWHPSRAGLVISTRSEATWLVPRDARYVAFGRAGVVFGGDGGDDSDENTDYGGERPYPK